MDIVHNIKKKVKQNIGVLFSIFFIAIFLILDNMLAPHFDGAQWYIVSSIERLLFGIVELFVFIALYKKGNWTNVINLKNYKKGILASSGLLILILFYCIYLLIGAKSFINTTFMIVISCLLFQQITTGFWEEITCRAFLLEGYFAKEERTWKDRLKYALLSFAFFGLVHIIGCDDLAFAIYRFLITGIMGFVYASIYLCSHNILIPMLMHFIYDVFANATIFVAEWNQSTIFTIWDNYVYFIAMGIMLIISTIHLIKSND